MNEPRSLGRLCAIGALVWSLAGLASAAPVIQNLSLRGLQTGATTTITIEGSELAPETRLLLPVPIADQKADPQNTAARATFAVTLAADVPAGIYPLRVAGPTGVSNTVLVGVDSLPQLPFAEEVATLPAALHGDLTGSATLRSSFLGKKGQTIVADVEARRLGAKLNPMLHLLDARGVQLAWGQATGSIGGDARVRFELPADGKYSVELHDALHQGAAPGFFRLKLGALAYADMVHPLAVKRNSQAMLELVGGGFAADQRAAANAATASFEALASWPAVPGCTGARPAFLVTDANEYVENPAGGPQQVVPAVPLGINGRIAAAKEEDVYRLAVAPGAQLRFDVLANRAGSPLDAVLSIRNEQGGELAASDDRPGTVDPGLDFTVPAGATTLLLAIRDLVGRGGAEYLYRISVTPAAQVGFRLTAFTDRAVVPRDGAAVIRVGVERTGFDGPVKLQLGELPAGAVLHGDTILPGMKQALVTLSAPGAAIGHKVSGLAAVSADPAVPLAGAVEVTGAESGALPRGLRDQVIVAVVNPGPLRAEWAGLSPEQPLVAGNKTPVKIKIARAAGIDGPVRLTLLTSQVVPTRTVKKNNQDVQEENVSKALRWEGSPMIAPGATQADAVLLVPIDLPPSIYDLALRAELLSADGKQTVAEANTLAVRMRSVAAPPTPTLAVFEDQPEFVAALAEGSGQATLSSDDKHSGAASVKVTPDRRAAAALPAFGAGLKIREIPGPGEYRYLRFAWKKQGGQLICVEVGHDGKFGPQPNQPAKFRYHAGRGAEPFGGSMSVDPNPPSAWTVVTRDLFADFGEFTLTGLGLGAVDAEYGLFDAISLGRALGDLDAPAK